MTRRRAKSAELRLGEMTLAAFLFGAQDVAAWVGTFGVADPETPPEREEVQAAAKEGPGGW